jgi:hypothetical protein
MVLVILWLFVSDLFHIQQFQIRKDSQQVARKRGGGGKNKEIDSLGFATDDLREKKLNAIERGVHRAYLLMIANGLLIAMVELSLASFYNKSIFPMIKPVV